MGSEAQNLQWERMYSPISTPQDAGWILHISVHTYTHTIQESLGQECF